MIKWIVLPLVIVATVLLLRFLIIGKQQYRVINDMHSLPMTVIYTMTFSSFIGAFALTAVFLVDDRSGCGLWCWERQYIQDYRSDLQPGTREPSAGVTSAAVADGTFIIPSVFARKQT